MNHGDDCNFEARVRDAIVDFADGIEPSDGARHALVRRLNGRRPAAARWTWKPLLAGGLAVAAVATGVLVLANRGSDDELNTATDCAGGIAVQVANADHAAQVAASRIVVEKRLSGAGIGARICDVDGGFLVAPSSVSDIARLRSAVSSTGLVEFRGVAEVGSTPTGATTTTSLERPCSDPIESCIAWSQDQQSIYKLGAVELDGTIIKSAKARTANEGPGVDLDFTEEGGRAFNELATQFLDQQIAIVLDGVVYSAPRIMTSDFSGTARISGSFTQEEAGLLAAVLNNGRYPVDVLVGGVPVRGVRGIRGAGVDIRLTPTEGLRNFVALDQKGRLAIWDPRTGMMVREVQGADKSHRLTELVVDRDLARAFTVISSTTVVEVDLSDGSEKTLGPGGCLSLSPDGQTLLRLALDGSVIVRDLGTNGDEQIGRSRVSSGCPKWSPDGRRVAFRAVTSGIDIVDVGTKTTMSLPTVADAQPFTIVRWLTDGKHLVVQARNQLRVLDSSTAKTTDEANPPEYEDVVCEDDGSVLQALMEVARVVYIVRDSCPLAGSDVRILDPTTGLVGETPVLTNAPEVSLLSQRLGEHALVSLGGYRLGVFWGYEGGPNDEKGFTEIGQGFKLAAW